MVVSERMEGYQLSISKWFHCKSDFSYLCSENGQDINSIDLMLVIGVANLFPFCLLHIISIKRKMGLMWVATDCVLPIGFVLIMLETMLSQSTRLWSREKILFSIALLLYLKSVLVNYPPILPYNRFVPGCGLLAMYRQWCVLSEHHTFTC